MPVLTCHHVLDYLPSQSHHVSVVPCSTHMILRDRIMFSFKSASLELTFGDHGKRRHFPTRVDTSLVEVVRDMPRHRPVTDAKHVVDLAVGPAGGQQREDLSLPAGELTHGHARPGGKMLALRPTGDRDAGH